ncbi:PcfJ domain-containing protein [Wenyingzhuangia sp. 1_MG-2023]|nr:PcfJ domain-containing protein [Wenyingzhuangia sp. 1_MG-2023]
MENTVAYRFKKEWEQEAGLVSKNHPNLQASLIELESILTRMIVKEQVEYCFLKRVWRYYISKLKKGNPKYAQELKHALRFLYCYRKSLVRVAFYLIDNEFFNLMKIYAKYTHYVIQKPVLDKAVLKSSWDLILLFEDLFVPYETPIKLVESIDLYNEIEVDFVFCLLHNVDVRKHAALPVPLSKAEIHILKNFPLEVKLREQHRYFWRLIFATKCLNKGMSPDFLSEFIERVHVFNDTYIKTTIKAWIEVGAYLVNMNFKNSGYDIIEFVDYFNHKINRNPFYRCKKKNLRALQQAIDKWHYSSDKGDIEYRKLKWANKSINKTWIVDGTPYHVIRFANGEELHKEGTELKHCVLSYAKWCRAKECQIWSIRDKEKKLHYTVELLGNKVVQNRGYKNKVPNETEQKILNTIYKKMNWIRQSE